MSTVQKKTIVTCAVTGSLTMPGQTDHLPITPEEIAVSALEAAEAGAAIVHIHVRHGDGTPSVELSDYREVVERIRAKNTGLMINLTTGPGGRYHPSDENPGVPGPRTSAMPPLRRLEHVVALKPEIATLDLNTMLFGSEVVINTPANLRVMAEAIYDSGVLPELELFDASDIELARDLLERNVLRMPGLASLVLGVKYGFAADTQSMLFAKSRLPEGVAWTGFGVGRHAYPMLAQSFILGGHVRIGFEDTVYSERGQKATTNAELVQKGVWLIDKLGGSVATAAEARDIVGLS